jgi:lipopolysaccharide/colanic/teichoic acid biosynthesis glycosyltransferase
MLITALAIKLDSPGPIIYKSKRMGENGRIFHMYKFRSMCQDADVRQKDIIKRDKDGNIIHKSTNDSRVTRVGKFIRKTSIDELAQMFNIFKGDMSLVGPRPELPMLVYDYQTWQFARFAVPQGLTGWWQVNGRSSKLMHLHTEYDLYYVQNYSLMLDVKILWKTVPAVVKRSGAF